MADIANVVKNLLGGADAKTVRSIALIVVDAMKRIEGEAYVLVPKNSLSSANSAGAVKNAVSAVKKPKKWGKVIEGCDYSIKPNGYAIQGGWANVYDLSKHGDGTRVMVSIPSLGLFVGTVKTGHDYEYEYPSGTKGTIKHFKCEFSTEQNDYEQVITHCKTKGVVEYDSRANK